MAGYTQMKENEQLFLREQVKSRYHNNIGKVFNGNSSDSSMESLFNDIVRVLDFDGSKIKEKEGSGDTFFEESFGENGSGLECYCSYRALKEFFYQDKKRLDTKLLTTLYLYLGNGDPSWIDRYREMDPFYVNVLQEEHRMITNEVWNYFKGKEGDTRQSFQELQERIYENIVDSSDSQRPDIDIEKDRILGLLGKHSTHKKHSVTTLNTLYYYFTKNQKNRTEFLKTKNSPQSIEKVKTSSAQLNEEVKKEVWIERPELPMYLCFAASTVLIVVWLVGNGVESNLRIAALFGMSVVLFSGIVWFLLLLIQAQKELTKRFLDPNKVNDFWLWWFGRMPLSPVNNSNTNSVNVLVIYDDSYEVQESLAMIREKFQIVSVSTFVSKADNIDSLREVLWEEEFAGLYFFLTEGISKQALSVIKEWSIAFEDTPIVYVDFLGKDLPDGYGKVAPQEAGTGLWKLLVQALMRTKLWKNQTHIYRIYFRKILLSLFVVCLLMAFLSVYEDMTAKKEIRSLSNKVQLIEKDAETLKDEKQYFLESILANEEKIFINMSKGHSRNDINLSAFVTEGNRINEIGRTDGEDIASFGLGSKKGVVTYAANGPWETALSRRGDSTVYGVANDGELIPKDNSNNIFQPDKSKKKQHELQGIMCACKKGKDSRPITVCIAVVRDTSLADYLFSENRKETLENLQLICSYLSKWDESKKLGKFPKPDPDNWYE
ncbi:MAG: hypothetical protein AAFN93_06970 [Bacteroidota bacterium]